MNRWALNWPRTRSPPVTRATLIPHKRALYLHNLIISPPTPTTPIPALHSLRSCEPPVSASHIITMSYSMSYSGNGAVSSAATWPNPWTVEEYPHNQYLSVPQSTYPGHVSAPGYPFPAGTYIPDFNAAANAACSHTPTSEMGAFANLPVQADFTNQVSSKCWNVDMDLPCRAAEHN